MFENIATIDIGSSSVKLIKIKTGLKNFQIKSFSLEEIDQNETDHEAAVKSALSRLLAEDDLKGCTIICSFPLEKTIIRNLSFPFDDIDKITKAVPFEAEETIPFPLDELCMDFQPVDSTGTGEGKIILAAARRESVRSTISLLSEFSLAPEVISLESNALAECYRYYNTVQEETVLQIDMGYSKTIVNILKNGSLHFTRSISSSMYDIYDRIATLLDTDIAGAVSIFNTLRIDLSAPDNSLKDELYKTVKIKKNQAKKITEECGLFIKKLSDQIMLTLQAYDSQSNFENFSRILISGGGANINGIGSSLARQLGGIVVSMPMPEEFREHDMQHQFTVAFGQFLAHSDRRRQKINFLKEAFTGEKGKKSRKAFYLSGFFLILTLITLVINIVSSIIITSISNSEIDETIQSQYKKLFKVNSAVESPLDEARKKLKSSRKEIETISSLVPLDERLISIIHKITSSLKNDGSFEVTNMVYNERIMRIDGKVSSASIIDQMRNQLQKDQAFESVQADIKSSGKTEVIFTLTIQQKKRK